MLRASTAVGRWLACNSSAATWTQIVQECTRNLWYRAGNVDFDFETNGELRVVEVLGAANEKSAVVFDVGANRGEWSRLAVGKFDHPIIHAFEAIPSTAELCRAAVADTSGVFVNAFGLSSKSEVKLFFTHGQVGDAAASAFPLRGESAAGYVPFGECKLVRGDEYMAANRISTVNFLKIDVEGMDHHVLHGFGNQLNNVAVIQFEYGVFNIQSRTLLKDFYDLLVPFGFQIGKIYPRGVDFCPYRFTDENFMGNNFLAARPGSPIFAQLAGAFKR